MGNFSVMDFFSADAAGQQATAGERTTTANIQLISARKLVASKDNFYSTEDIADLKQSIGMFGLLQNLVVVQLPGADKYLIKAGHRRHKAIMALLDDGRNDLENQLHPGQTWGYAVNQNDGGGGHDANAYLADYYTMVLVGGYNGSSALCAKWVDITSWSTLSFTFSYTALSYFQLRWGVYSAGTTGILGANEIRVTKVDGASGNYVGTHQINVSDLSGGVYILVYLYAGSSLAANQVNITNVTLT